MFKRIVLLALVIITASGIANITADESTITGHISELTPKFSYETGKVIKARVEVFYIDLLRGEEVDIIDEDDIYYYIDRDSLVLAIKKVFIRTQKEKEFERYLGYTKKNAGLFSDYELSAKIKSFKLNDNVNVIDGFNGVLLVEYEEGKYAYMSSSSVSDKKIIVYTSSAPAAPSNDGGGGSSDGGSGGGNSGGGGSSPVPSEPSPSSGDGQDISLSYTVPQYETINLADSNIIKGKILADGTKAYITVLRRNDVVKILEYDDEKAIILINGFKGTIKRNVFRMDDEIYESWKGYTRSGTATYRDPELKERISTYKINTVVKVIDYFDGVYVIELDDGSEAYVSKNNVSEKKFSTYVAPSAPSTQSSDDGGGGGGGDSGGGGGGSPPAPSEPEWTEPVL